ncbi:MAG: hypothetical protein AAGI10_06930 [Pseudomonadota bacterium]
MILTLRLAVLWAATAAALLGWSEFIFVNEGPVRSILDAGWAVHTLGLWAFYLIPAAALLALWRLRWPATWWQAVVAGCLVGWIIEGAMVPAVYEAAPLSFVWTSMAWHAPVDVMLGLWLLPRLMDRDVSAWALALTLSACGVAVGIWALWTVGNAQDALNMTAWAYGSVLLLGISGAVIGAIAWAAWGHEVARLPKSLTWAALAACSALFVMQGLIAPFWLTALCILAALTFWAHMRQENRKPISTEMVPIRAVWFTLFGVAALLAYRLGTFVLLDLDTEIITFFGFLLGSLIAGIAILRGFISR